MLILSVHKDDAVSGGGFKHLDAWMPSNGCIGISRFILRFELGEACRIGVSKGSNANLTQGDGSCSMGSTASADEHHEGGEHMSADQSDRHHKTLFDPAVDLSPALTTGYEIAVL
jgi:hypothetical protein